MFDLDAEDFAIDCSGFVSHMLFRAFFEGEGHTDLVIGGKAMVSPSYTMNGIESMVNGSHGPFSSSYANATASGTIMVEGVSVVLVGRDDIADIERGDVMTRSGHVALVDGISRITDDFYILDVLHSVCSTGVKRSTYYLGTETNPAGETTFKYYSSSSKLRNDTAYHDVRFASFSPE